MRKQQPVACFLFILWCTVGVVTVCQIKIAGAAPLLPWPYYHIPSLSASPVKIMHFVKPSFLMSKLPTSALQTWEFK
jgi:hypothetical protein